MQLELGKSIIFKASGPALHFGHVVYVGELFTLIQEDDRTVPYKKADVTILDEPEKLDFPEELMGGLPEEFFVVQQSPMAETGTLPPEDPSDPSDLHH